MSTESVDRLFEEFVSAYGQGRNPDLRDYLDRAGSARAELGRMIDRYLAIAPIAETDDETLVLLSARIAGRTPIAEARERRNLTVTAVVERLREVLGLATSLTDRLQDAYEDLERDWLDPRGVRQPVWAALEGIFGFNVRKLVTGPEPEPLAWEAVLLRRETREGPASPGTAAEPRPRDEVDELFRSIPE
jgi:hypothetical protein